MLVARSQDHAGHHALELHDAQLIPSFESPERADHVDRVLDSFGTFTDIEPLLFDAGLVRSIHTADYLEFLETAFDQWTAAGSEVEAAMGYGWPTRGFSPHRPTGIDALLGYHSFAADCSITAHTWKAVSSSAALADTAASAVADGESAAFARCRPPGHHAMKDQFGGYCYVNNAAVAAQRLRQTFDRVAILDVDYHHGNGTQDIFYDRSDVAFASIHADPKTDFPYFLGHADEQGVDEGEGANLNVPLDRGTESAGWFKAMDQTFDWLDGHQPQALVVSLGVDTFIDDPISHFRLGHGDFTTMGQRIRTLGLPTVFVMEGGYATAALGENMVAVLNGFEQA